MLSVAMLISRQLELIQLLAKLDQVVARVSEIDIDPRNHKQLQRAGEALAGLHAVRNDLERDLVTIRSQSPHSG
jgi:hypothetical protein